MEIFYQKIKMISKKKIMLVHQEMVKEKNLILKKVKKDLKIEVDLNHLNLKNRVKQM